MAKHEIVAAVDLGSQTIRCVIAATNDGSVVEILGYGSAPSKGFKRGIIVNIRDASTSIENAVAAAEKAAGFEISSIYISVAGEFLSTTTTVGEVAIVSSDRVITENDVRRVNDAARLLAQTTDSEIIQVLPRSYIVDGFRDVRSPVGMSAMRLQVDAIIVTALKTSVANLTKAVEDAGLEIEEDGIILSGYATGLAVLTPELSELGAIIIDIGHDTTDIAIFKYGNLIYSMSVLAGGYNVTYDIAICFGVLPSEAERIKLARGVAKQDLVVEDEELQLEALSSVNPKEVSLSDLAYVIECRLSEIIEKVKRPLEELAKDGYHVGAILLLGGTSAIKGISNLTEGTLDYPVKMAAPVGVDALQQELADPSYAAALGVIKHAATKRTRTLEKPPSSSKLSEIVNKALQWLHEIF